MAYLVVDPGGTPRVYKLSERTAIGRDRENSLQLEDLRVSRFHCRIQRTTAGLFKLTDLASAGGTRLNGQRVTEALLRTGDRIRLGSSELVFCHSRLETTRTMRPPTLDAEETQPPLPSEMNALDAVQSRLADTLAELARFGAVGKLAADRAVAQAFDGEESPDAAALRHQRNRLLELMEINRALTSEVDLGRLFEMILDHLVHLTGAEQAFLLMFDDEGQPLVECYRNAQGVRLERPEQELSRTVIDRVREQRQALYAHDAVGDESLAGFDSITKLKLRSILCLPLAIDGKVEGALYVENRVRRRAFDAEEVELIEAFGDQASIALRNARQREEIIQHNRNLRALYDVSRAVASTLELDLILDVLVGKIFAVTPATRVALLLPDEGGNLVFRMGRDGAGTRPVDPHDIDGLVDRVKRGLHKHEDDDALILPLIARAKEHLGVLFAESEEGFDPSESDLVTQIADAASLALSNARLYQRATMDALTGLYKRDYFDGRLREEVLRAERYQTPMSLVMADLDHFKKLNDTHGHPVGDEALRVVGGLLREALREIDIPARYGGEEFALIMPQTTIEQAEQVAERIRKAIAEQQRFPYRLTASLGIATWEPGLHDTQLVERADKALYRAKDNGRNRIERWTAE